MFIEQVTKLSIYTATLLTLIVISVFVILFSHRHLKTAILPLEFPNWLIFSWGPNLQNPLTINLGKSWKMQHVS